MELVPGNGYGFPLLGGRLDSGGVEVEVEVGAYRESRYGGGVGDETADCLVGFKRSSTPVPGDPGEEPVFNLVPFTGAGRVVADGDVQAGGRGQSSDFEFPPPPAVMNNRVALGYLILPICSHHCPMVATAKTEVS